MRIRLAAAWTATWILAAVAPGADLRPELVEAARNGSLGEVRALLRTGADVNAAEADGSTALLWASYRSEVEMVGALLDAGAKAGAANDLGVTPLWAASQNGNLAIVRRLLDAGVNPGAAILSGETSLMIAARGGYAAVVEALIARGANIDARGARGQTALMWAAARKHPTVVKTLLEHHAGVHLRSDTWSQVMAVPPHGHLEYNRAIPHGSDTALLFAVRSGDLASVRLLVAAGANVNDQDAWGVSATVLAAHSRDPEIVEFLLEAKADPNRAEAGFTALHAAILRRDERSVRALLVHGADANAPLRTWTPTRRSSRDYHFQPALVGATPFWLAARFLQPGVMRLLARHGADCLFLHNARYVLDDLESRNERTTALMASLGMGGGSSGWEQPERGERETLALEAAKAAVELGVDVNAANTDGRTALAAAKGLRYQRVVEFLTSKGAR